MLPAQMKIEQFDQYPLKAREVAVKQIALLRRLPLGYVPLLLREVIAYDWKFPVERHEIERDFEYLGSLRPEAFQREMAPFQTLKLTAELESFDWVNSPLGFSEMLTAHLWATHQIDQFRLAAVQYVNHRNAATAERVPATHRLGIAVIGQGVAETNYPLFRKLRPHGQYFRQVNPAGGMEAIVQAVAARAQRHPEPFAHWYIDGGAAASELSSLTGISYQSLDAVRAALQKQMQRAYEGGMGAEAMKSLLARLRPEDLGIDAKAGDSTLNHFKVSVLTEGSGTQVFSTTFVQWAAREALRRAQPQTMLVRFAPRQRERPMNELLEESQRRPELDPQGSLIDSDMGAYYTWLNQQRLPATQPSRFLAWFQGHAEAVVIGPGFEANQVFSDRIDLTTLLNRLS